MAGLGVEQQRRADRQRRTALLVGDVQPLLRLSVTCIAERGGTRAAGHVRAAAAATRSRRCSTTTAPSASRARRRARRCVNLDAVDAPAGTMTVVLGPGWPGILLHEAIGHGLEGDFNRKGTSAFTDRIGTAGRVASSAPWSTTARSPNRRGSLNVDDEGTPTGRTVLIENGILRGYLQDRLNARLMGMPLTGNGRRESFAHMPMPRMTNTFMLAGEDDARGHHPLGRPRPLRGVVRRRPGRHHQRQVRLLGERGLPDRGRHDRRAR